MLQWLQMTTYSKCRTPERALAKSHQCMVESSIINYGLPSAVQFQLQKSIICSCNYPRNYHRSSSIHWITGHYISVWLHLSFLGQLARRQTEIRQFRVWRNSSRFRNGKTADKKLLISKLLRKGRKKSTVAWALCWMHSRWWEVQLNLVIFLSGSTWMTLSGIESLVGLGLGWAGAC